MNILYSEDYAPFRFMVAKKLTKLGHKVTEVSDGYGALSELAKGNKFDVMISDGHMVVADKTKPEINGYTLLSMAEAKAVPIKILLSSDADMYKEAAKEDGKDKTIYFLNKEEEKLIEKLGNYIKKHAPLAGASQSSKPGKISMENRQGFKRT